MAFLRSLQLALCALSFLLLSQDAVARLPDGRVNANMAPVPTMPRVSVDLFAAPTALNGSSLPPLDTVYYFDQLIDHTNPSLGTFQQRYWQNWAMYQEGGPIVLCTPGESAADGYEGYMTNATVNGVIAQQHGGAAILIEHRFYGESNPYPDLSVKSLQVHTLAQATADLAYFAQNVNLMAPAGVNTCPNATAWVLIGGSYAGALVSWTMVSQPGVFWAGYASSGVVQAIVDYYAYFTPIREYMPQNCSADVQAVVAYFDQVLTSGNDTAIQALKDSFGMSDVDHLDDVAGALRNNLWDWQELQPTSGPNAQFFQFCDALEVDNGVSAPVAGWGLDHALAAWGSYFKNTYYSIICGDQDANDCLGTYNTSQSYWSDTSLGNSGRSWMWIVCNEVGYLQESAPEGTPSIVSQLIQPIYDERQCQQMFAEQWTSPPTPRADQTNAVYQGWNVTQDRLIFANGLRDPWRESTVSADGLSITSTPSQPIVVGDGFHCSDLGISGGKVDATIAQVQQAVLKYMDEWLSQWKQPSSSTNHRRALAEVNVIGKPVNAWSRGSGTF